MASTHRSVNLILFVLVAMMYASVILLQTANAKALTRQARSTSTASSAAAATTTNVLGFPTNVKVEDESDLPKNSCFVVKTTEFVKENVILMDGMEVSTEQTTPVTVRECCPGYTGIECNQLTNASVQDPYALSNPCKDKTCPNHPDAVCQVVTVCGEDIPVFLDAFGQILDCENENEQDSTSIDTLQCNGFCASNPCAGLTCDMFPSAVCLVMGCDCEPIWLLDNGVRVDCSSGNPIDPAVSLRKRRRRQTDDMTSETSTCR